MIRIERNWKLLDFKNPLSHADRYISWILGIAALAYFLIFAIHAYSYDGLAYAGDVVSPEPFQHFHPHHLLYSRVNWLFLRLVNLFAYNTSPLVTMSWLNSILGALTVVVFYRMAVRLSGKRIISGLLAAVLVTSRGFHIFSAMPETVIPPIFFLLLVYYLAMFKGEDKTRLTIIIAVIFSVAILFHQTSILYLPALAVIFWFNSSKSKRLAQLAILLCLSLFMVAAAYISVIWLYLGMEPEQWMTYPTHYLHSTLGGAGVWFDWGKAITYWFSTGNSAFIGPADFKWQDLLFVDKILVWGLVITAVIITILRTIRKELFGTVIFVQLLGLMSFFSWWLIDCADYWVMPWVLLLVLVAWVMRYFNSRIAAIWLCFYLPIGFLTNWVYQISTMVNPTVDREDERIIRYISRNYDSGHTILISERWDLCLRAPIAGIEDINWAEESLNLDGLLDDISVMVEGNNEPTIICSNYVKQALEITMAEPTRKMKFALINKAIEKATIVPQFDGTNAREKLWVLGNGDENR